METRKTGDAPLSKTGRICLDLLQPTKENSPVLSKLPKYRPFNSRVEPPLPKKSNKTAAKLPKPFVFSQNASKLERSHGRSETTSRPCLEEDGETRNIVHGTLGREAFFYWDVTEKKKKKTFPPKSRCSLKNEFFPLGGRFARKLGLFKRKYYKNKHTSQRMNLWNSCKSEDMPVEKQA